LSELPSGTVTFLFTDIEGSTRLLKSLGDRYEGVLTEHDRCLREAFAAGGGQEVDTQGDAFFAVFARAADAVSAAADVQRRLAECAWPEGADVRIRIGIHTAEPKVGQHRYIGLGVHRAARICAAAHGGQILISNTTRELVEDTPDAGFELRDLGSHSLKDLDRPEHLFQLVGPNLLSEFPPVRSAGAQADVTTPFAGREGELARAAQAALVARRALRRRPVLLALLAGALAAAVAVAVPLFARDQGGEGARETPAARSVPRNSLAALDPTTNRLVASAPVGDTPGPIAVDSSEVWVGNLNDDTMTLMDPKSLEALKTVGLPIKPNALAVGAGAVWVAYNGCTPSCLERAGASGTRVDDVEPVELAKFDLAKGRVLWRTKLGNGGPGAVDIALSGGSVWVSNEADWTVSRVDPETGEVQDTVTDKVDGPKGIAGLRDAVWVLSYPNSWVARIDSRTGIVVATVPIEKPWALGAGGAGIWVAGRFGEIVWRIDPSQNQAAESVRIPGLATGVAVGDKRIWVAHRASGTVTSVDPETGRPKTVELGRPLGDIAVGSGAIWVTVR
jgi:class 3 adenylate cyclase/streptogramin lyase